MIPRTCMQCREAGRLCSLTKDGDSDICAACELEDRHCLPVKLAVTTPQHHNDVRCTEKVPMKKRQTRDLVAQPTPTKLRKTVKPSPGETNKIVTKFCHPIAFNHEDVDGTKPCNFCGPSSYAILGMEPKEVEVIDWADGRGLTEMGGGHMACKGTNTRVCTDCTTKRMRVIMCPKHSMRPFPGVSQDTVDMDAALNALLSGEQRGDDNWCVLCPSLATYECDEQSMSASGVGCGLSLCEYCMLNLTGSYDGDLQMMLAGLQGADEPSAERPFGLRADAELLKQDGLLMRYVLWSTQP